MARTLILIILAAVLAASVSGCASREVANQVAPGSTLPPPDMDLATGVYAGTAEYRLGAQDLLEVSVFGVPDLSRTVRVNSNGQISLPLVGGVMAGGRSIPELETELAKRYADGYLQHPQVSVFVKEFASQRVTLEGSLEKPGIYPLTGATTLLQGIAMAGDLDPLADLRGVIVFRMVDGRKMAAVYDMSALRTGQMVDPPLYGGDLVVVEQSNSKTALRYFIESIPALGLFLAFGRNSKL